MTLSDRNWAVIVFVAGLCVGAATLLSPMAPIAVMLAFFGALLSVFQPVWTLLLLFITTLLDTLGTSEIMVGPVMITASKVTVLLVIGVHTLRVAFTRQPWIRVTPLTAGFTAMILSGVISIAASGSISAALPVLSSVVLLTLMFHIIDAALDPEQLPMLLRMMAWVMNLLMLYTLLSASSPIAKYYGLDVAWQARTSGGLGDPNEWAAALLLLCPPLIAFLTHDKNRWATLQLVTMAIAFPACIMQSLSRAGMIGFFLILPMLLWVNRSRKRTLTLGALVFLIVLPRVINIDSALLRYETIFDPTLETSLGHGSLRERTGLLHAGLDMFYGHPWLGVGLGTFQEHSRTVTVAAPSKIAHNSFLNVAAEQGLVGIALHLILALSLLRLLHRLYIHAKDRAARDLAVGVITGFAGFALMALTLNLLTFNAVWIMAALACVLDRTPRDTRAPQAVPKSLSPPPATGLEASRPAELPHA